MILKLNIGYLAKLNKLGVTIPKKEYFSIIEINTS